MKRSKFSNEQILAIVKEGEAGRKVTDLCRANTVRPHSALRKATPEQFANSLGGRSPARTPARADWKNKDEEKNEDPKPEDLSLSV